MSDPTTETTSSQDWSTETQTGYCSIADLQKKIGMQKLAELTNDAFVQGKSNEGAPPDVDVCNALIAEADAEIDSIVAMRYTTPFDVDAVPDVINETSVDMTVYLAFKRKLPANDITKAWEKTWNESINKLHKIASGEIEIGETKASSQGIISNPAVQQTQFYDTDYAISDY